MAGDELIDSRVSVKQCKRAIDAIHSHQAKKTDKESANELLPGKEQFVWLNVAVKKVAAERKIMPVQIPVVHPIVDPRTSAVCLITKDPQREYKDLLEAKEIKFISRVVGINKLKGKFKPFEARRILLKEHGLFLADDRVIPLLPKLLGEKWFNAKKQPIPVTLTRKDLKKELEQAIESTYMNQNCGTNTAIKIGNMSHTPAQILANLKAALPVIAKRISGGWDNVQALSVKTSTSVSLPIWSCSLGDEEGGRWEGLNVDPDAKSGEADEDEAMVVDKPASKKPKSPSNGKKRAAADDEPEETSKPKKKTKGAEGKSVPEPSKAGQGKALITAGSPSKKEKVKAVTSSATKVAADSSKESKAPAPEDSVPPVTKPTPSTDAPSTSDDHKKARKGKKRKPKASSDASVPNPAPVPAPGPSPASETKELKNKVSEITQPDKKDEGTGTKQAKKRKSVNKEIDTPSTADSEAKSEKVSPKETVVPSVSAPVDGPSKKSKKRKTPESVDDGVAKATTDSLTADDLKKKRSAAPGEKKKDKVVKVKKGKSAKNDIIGKKSVLA